MSVAIRLGRFVSLALLLCPAGLPAQRKPDSLSSLIEFPVILRQNVTAGKTLSGTKIQAQLVIATLFDGAVLPKGAIFSGEVVESSAKSATAPSRLSLRMDTVQWKNGSRPVKVYLTAWYYPLRSEADDPDEPSGLHGSVGITLGSGGYYPPPIYPDGRSPDDNQGAQTATPPPTPASSISSHRVQMKEVESMRGEDGSTTLVSKTRNLKLDKTTTFVLAAGDLLPRTHR